MTWDKKSSCVCRTTSMWDSKLEKSRPQCRTWNGHNKASLGLNSKKWAIARAHRTGWKAVGPRLKCA